MSFFSLIRNAACLPENKTETVKTKTPLNLAQGNLIEIPLLEVDIAIAEGSIIGKPKTNHETIVAVGSFIPFSLTKCFHSYLSDGSFVRTVEGHENDQVMLFVPRDEILPQTKEDWGFWIGNEGLIGWSQFQVANPNAIIYDKAWDKALFTERLVSITGDVKNIKHEGCEYTRKVSDHLQEHLLVYTSQCGNEASVNIYIGIPLPPKDVKVFQTT